MTLLLTTNESGDKYTGIGNTILSALAAVEKAVQNATVDDFNLTDDSAFDASKCVKAMENGETYYRSCFSTPEENYTIVFTD